jgi:glutaredoxin
VSAAPGTPRRRWLLPATRAPRDATRDDGAGRAARRLTMLTRSWCHLCDEMRAALTPLAAAQSLEVVLIDVDADAALEATFGERVPVLFVGDVADGREVCHARFDGDKLAAALAATPEIR